MNSLILIAQAATETHTATESAGGIGALGLDWRALLFQILNFAILLALLRAFAYKPIMNILEERRRRIVESLKNAEDITATKAALAKEKENVLAHARAQAEQLVKQGKQRAAEVIAAAEEAATERAATMMKQTEARLTQEVATARQGLRAEVVQLVAAATEKIIDVKLDAPTDAALIEKVVRKVQP